MGSHPGLSWMLLAGPRLQLQRAALRAGGLCAVEGGVRWHGGCLAAHLSRELGRGDAQGWLWECGKCWMWLGCPRGSMGLSAAR